MAEVLALDWRCSQCGDAMTWQLVKPAPSQEQSGFARRNAASYASFPKSTNLRLLMRDHVGGKTFSLLGFRDADSLCLRLVRADLPAARTGLSVSGQSR